jgi:pyruvate dehydrogenase E2 component (dihydrolipoamide acetyltransferase)
VSQEIRIPDIGDAESVEVVEILVVPGDAVGPDDPVIVIESDKASMEVPAGQSGVVGELAVAVGDQVTAGQVIARLREGGDAKKPAQPEKPAQSKKVAAAQAKPAPAAAERPPAPAPAQERAPQSSAAAAPESGGSTAQEVRVPDIGEVDHVTVIDVAVAIGAEVTADDLLVVIESDKASMEIPVGVAGRVAALHVKEGDEVDGGALLATIEIAAPAGRAEAPAEQPKTTARTDAPGPAPSRGGSSTPTAAARPAPEAASADPEEAEVYAGPAVRQLARELGVKLEQVPPSGPRGRIVKDDVKSFVKSRMSSPAGVAQAPRAEVDFSRFGPVETVPFSRVRARGGDNVHRSWTGIPHVTQHDEVDVTELEQFRRSLKAEAETQGVKLTPLAFLIKACCQALKEFPTVNSSLDGAARNYIVKRYYHIGIAVDTEEGLVVPVIRDADQKGVIALARDVMDVSDRARKRRLTPADNQGGTFSISSLGALGGTGFTPIINAPEVAILGVGRLATRPQWNGSAFVPREMLPLSLSYDHRALNGAEAGRFVARLAELLRDIRRLVL